MYSDADLDSAIAAGIITPEAAAALREHAASLRATPMVDEEQFRLLTGFNDIFVSIAGVLLLTGIAWTGGRAAPFIGAAGVAAASWGLAEYFTRVRRMALPSIMFLLSFVGGIFAAGAALLHGDMELSQGDSTGALLMAVAAAIAAAAAWAHWRRFKVPITIAAGAAAVVGGALLLLIAAVPDIAIFLYPLMTIAGLGVFALAMRWDMSDPLRQTRRSDVAFWLHLLAAPLIVHPVFATLGVFSDQASAATALLVVALYLGLGFVALAIDRRALMVSALAYVLYAVGALFRQFGAVGLNLALTVLIIGSALLLLSAFWQTVRAAIVGLLPADLARLLPPVGRMPLSPRPAS